MSTTLATAGNRKTLLVGGLCLLSSLVLAWFVPRGEHLKFSEGEELSEKLAQAVTKREREEKHFERGILDEYLVKSERGMEVKELRWVVEDFMALGLDVDYPEDSSAEGYLELRIKREKWYLGALVSALRLTKEQERQAEESMRVLRDKDFAEFQEYLKGVNAFDHEGKRMQIINGGKARTLMDAESWLAVDAYSPWLICELSEEQKAISGPIEERMAEDGATIGEFAPFHLHQPPVFLFLRATKEQDRKFNAAMVEAETILPVATCLNPDQLKIQFLLYPKSFQELMKELGE